jgi:hypothetical protein
MPNNNPQQTTPQQQIARAADSATKAAERLSEGAENATSMAIEKVRRVRDEAQSGIEHQRAQVADRIRRLGGVMRAGSQTLSTDDPLAEQLFNSASERIEQVAEYISNVTPGELANDVTSLARRSPALFFGGSFILGLALGRFVKSSASAAANVGEDDWDQGSLAARPAKRRARGAQTAGSTAEASSSGQATSSSQATSSGAAARATGAASRAPASGASSTPGTGGASSSPGTAGSGSSAPSYGSASSVTTASRPVQSSSSAAPSGTARDVERGEGSKS